ncbi:hypothetical protein WJX79_000707 [Trebouxia sp. C0005]
MQAIARLRLLRDLIRADVLPAAALHTVESAALRIVSGNGTGCQSFRVNPARYVASCPAVDPPAWLHTDPGHWAPYAARPGLENCEESFPAYLAMPTKKPSHLTHIVKKCKELAVTSINRGLVSKTTDDFFSSIWGLLERQTHLHQGIFYTACASAAVHVAEAGQAQDKKKTRLLHQQVLEVLRDGLQLKCYKDTSIQREHGHDLFFIDILIEEQPGVPHDIAVEVDGPENYIHNEPNKHRLLGPTAFRDLMLLRQVPRLITIPYYEWVDKGVHVAHTYLQDKLRTEGRCDLPDFVLPE